MWHAATARHRHNLGMPTLPTCFRHPWFGFSDMLLHVYNLGNLGGRMPTLPTCFRHPWFWLSDMLLHVWSKITFSWESCCATEARKLHSFFLFVCLFILLFFYNYNNFYLHFYLVRDGARSENLSGQVELQHAAAALRGLFFRHPWTYLYQAPVWNITTIFTCFNCSELELKEVLAYFILFSSPKHQSFALRRAQWCRLLMPLPSMYTNTMGSNMFWRVRYYSLASYTFFYTTNFFVHLTPQHKLSSWHCLLEFRY